MSELPRGVDEAISALAETPGADIYNQTSFMSDDLVALLYEGADAVLANSGHEPFGLVGLEVMAAGGIAFVGSTGEDYAVPYLNSVVLDTDDPSEITIALEFLRTHPEVAARIRADAQETARSFSWENVITDSLVGKLEYVALRQLVSPPTPQAAQAAHEPETSEEADESNQECEPLPYGGRSVGRGYRSSHGPNPIPGAPAHPPAPRFNRQRRPSTAQEPPRTAVHRRLRVPARRNANRLADESTRLGAIMAENLVTYCVIHQPRRIHLPAQVIPAGTKPGAMAPYLFDDRHEPPLLREGRALVLLPGGGHVHGYARRRLQAGLGFLGELPLAVAPLGSQTGRTFAPAGGSPQLRTRGGRALPQFRLRHRHQAIPAGDAPRQSSMRRSSSTRRSVSPTPPRW